MCVCVCMFMCVGGGGGRGKGRGYTIKFYTRGGVGVHDHKPLLSDTLPRYYSRFQFNLITKIIMLYNIIT